MQKSVLAPLMVASLLLVTSACQPQADRLEIATSSDASSTQTISPSAPPLKPAPTPKALTKALVTLSTKRLTDELICPNLTDEMRKIDDTSKFEEVTTIQRQLEVCLPSTDNKQALQWLADYQALYGRFLEINNNTNEQSFYTLMSRLEQGQKPSIELLKAINPRLLYLVGLVESDADVSVLYVGEGNYIFHHDLTAMAELFTPYLTQDQSHFVQRLAKDNQDIFWNDAAVAVSFEEVIERAKFWEDYIQRYPKSYFIQDAKHLFNLYRYTIFFGSNNTRWTNDAVNKFVSPKYDQALHKLAKHPNSTLAQDSQALLTFMAMSAAKRRQLYPVPDVDEDGYKIEDWAVARYQLNEALPLPSPWEAGNNRDCLSSIICVDYNFE